MAGFFCHVFAGTKRFRLERIVSAESSREFVPGHRPLCISTQAHSAGNSVHRRSAAALGCTESVAEEPSSCSEMQAERMLRNSIAEELHDVALTLELSRPTAGWRQRAA